MFRIIFIVFMLIGSVNASAKSLTYLSIATQAEPFQIINQSNKGIVTDILAQAVKDLDISLTEQAYPFMRYIHTMQAGNSPLWISYGSPAWQSTTQIGIQSRNLSKEKLFDVSHVLVIKSDKAINLYSIEALFGQTIITLNGFSYPGLEEYFASGEINTVKVKSHESALRAIESGRGVAFVAMKTRALYTMAEAGLDRHHFKLIDFSSIIPPYAIHLSYGDAVDEETKQNIDNALARLKHSGTVDKIIEFYQGNDKAQFKL